VPPTIRIDDQVWTELKGKAEPFVDTPNDVLRRLLGLNGSNGSSAPMVGHGVVTRRTKLHSKLRKGERTPEDQYFVPILQAVDYFKGRGRVEDVLNRVGEIMRGTLNARDRETLPTGQIRWRNAAQWARNTMVNSMDPSLLNPSSPNGWWEISDAGRAYLRDAVGK
jgi:hypothetical protein